MLKSLRKIHVDSRELSFVQDNILNTLNPVLKKEIVDGVLAEGFLIDTANTTVPHGLGRAPFGYIVVSKDASGDIFDVARDSRTITLRATTPITVSLWVF